jgi:hypothetical protein
MHPNSPTAVMTKNPIEIDEGIQKIPRIIQFDLLSPLAKVMKVPSWSQYCLLAASSAGRGCERIVWRIAKPRLTTCNTATNFDNILPCLNP